jgi:hypothetical protein
MTKLNTIYEELAHAIIKQAVCDYRKARRVLRENPKNDIATNVKKECETFFLSKWFSMLTELDGKALLTRLESEGTAI